MNTNLLSRVSRPVVRLAIAVAAAAAVSGAVAFAAGATAAPTALRAGTASTLVAGGGSVSPDVSVCFAPDWCNGG